MNGGPPADFGTDPLSQSMKPRKPAVWTIEAAQALDAVMKACAEKDQEIARLKRGDFTPEEFQALCHEREDRPGCSVRQFFDGCADYQLKLFGVSERMAKDQRIAELEAQQADQGIWPRIAQLETQNADLTLDNHLMTSVGRWTEGSLGKRQGWPG